MILTIGHSNHTFERFLDLLRAAGVEAIADVRSTPVSRFVPHFNRVALARALEAEGIAYHFMGDVLGGRPRDEALFTDGIADYEKMAAMASFRAGIDRLVEISRAVPVGAICSEADPLDCHRCLLVGRALTSEGLPVGHILRTGEIVAHAQIEERLLALASIEAGDLLATPAERLAQAYRDRNRKAAFVLKAAKR